MNRRQALQTMAASVAAFILPAPRPRLDLKRFCARLPGHKYDLRSPYCLEEWVYATDSFLCVRVRPEAADVVQHEGRIPPFDGLSWNHDRLTGWRPLPRLEALEADGSDCPRCEGYGRVVGDLPAVLHECPKCDGMGRVWVGAYELSTPRTCPACRGKGYEPPPGAAECPACGGNAVGRFPSIVRLDGRYFDSALYEKVRALGGEYLHGLHRFGRMPEHPLLKFRFSDGRGDALGLLMGVEGAAAEKRLAGGRA